MDADEDDDDDDDMAKKETRPRPRVSDVLESIFGVIAYSCFKGNAYATLKSISSP